MSGIAILGGILLAIAGCQPDETISELSQAVKATSSAKATSKGKAGKKTSSKVKGGKAYQLVFASNRNGNYDLFSISINGTALKPLTNHPGVDIHPAVSSDGSRLAFTCRRTSALGLCVMKLKNLKVTTITTKLAFTSMPVFSPDGKHIAFEGRMSEKKQPDIYLIPTAGGVAVRLTSDSHRDAGPVFSPDGKHIYFVSTRSGSFDIWKMNADGSGQVAVTKGSGILGRPAVAPDGLSLAFARTKPQTKTTEVVLLRSVPNGSVIPSPLQVPCQCS